MSRSSWTATAAGRRRAACRAAGPSRRRRGGPPRRSRRRSISASRYLTLYGFSSENWSRPRDRGRVPDRPAAAASSAAISPNCTATASACASSASATGCRADIRDAARRGRDADRRATAAQADHRLQLRRPRRDRPRRARHRRRGARRGRSIRRRSTHETIARHLDTAGIPDPDLIIRTGGELRLTNFLLWQAAYAELVFLPVYWPDFDRHAP